MSAKNLFKPNILATITVVITVCLIISSNLFGLLIGRNQNFFLALTDLAPLALYVLAAKLNPRVLFLVIFVTNLAALILNLIKATYLFYPSPSLQLIFEAYRLSETTGLDYWRFVGIAGQAGQAGLHAFLSLICLFLYSSSYANRRNVFILLTLILSNLFFSASRIAILFTLVFIILYVLFSNSKKLKLIFFFSFLASPFVIILLILPNLTQEFMQNRILNTETGLFRMKLLYASLQYSFETFPIGLGSQKRIFDANRRPWDFSRYNFT